MNKIKGLIFDMDGTMIDNMMVHHRAWQKRLLVAGLTLSLEEVIAKCHGKNDDILLRLFGDQYTFEERKQISHEKEDIYRTVFRESLTLVKGLSKLLENALQHQIPMGIGTAADIENVNYVLDNLNIRHYFSVIVCATDVNKGKPAPEVFFKVANQLGVAYEDCLVFEDSPTGAKAAENAGMNAIIITTTHQAHEFEIFPNVLKCVKDYTTINLFDN